MLLDATNKSITVVLGEAKTTSDCDVTAAWADITTTTFTDGSADTVTNGVTLITPIVAPAASTQRRVKQLSVFNNDTVQHTVIVKYVDGANSRIIWDGILAVGQLLLYSGETWNAGLVGGQGSKGSTGPTGNTGPTNLSAFGNSNAAGNVTVTSVFPTYKMAGLSCSYTPTVSGKVVITGQFNVSPPSGTAVVIMDYGTGAAPANGAAATGTSFGPAGSTSVTQQMTLVGTIVGLTIGVTYWLDVQVSDISNSVAIAIQNASFTIVELP